MIHAVLGRLHNTELWSNYLPRIPRGFGLPVLIGVALLGVSLLGPGSLRWIGLSIAVILLLPALAAWVFALWRSQQRLTTRKRMLDLIQWRGDETVLDVGCGSGLMLNGAAKRLTSGKATGIDIWADTSGGGDLELLQHNARAEGVADRITFAQADARAMPFADASFDVLLSSGALHHICHGIPDHTKVVGEMVRVLKPGGQIVLWDITHMIEATTLKMRQMGVESEVKGKGKFLGFEMAVMLGKKVG